MSELEFWRSAGMAPEASGGQNKRSGSGGKRGSGTPPAPAPTPSDDLRLQMQSQTVAANIQPPPKVSSRLGRSVTSAAPVRAHGARAPSLQHAPDNPAADSYRRPTPPAPGPARGVFLRTTSDATQRAVFKGTQKHLGSLVSRQQLAAMLRSKSAYITKDGKGIDGEKPDAFTDLEDRVDQRKMVDRWMDEGDVSASWHFISPEHGNRITDFRDYMRQVMFVVERDLLTKQELQAGHKIEWLGAIHGDTDQRHGHVIIRHRVNGKHFRIDQDYLNKGMSVRAAEVATQFLGERDLREIYATADREKTEQYREQRLSIQINRRTLGWRLEAKVNMRDLDGVDRLRGALRSAKIHNKLNEQTGTLTIFTSTYPTTVAAAEVIASDFGSVLRLPDADAMKRGMQFSPRLWGRFVTPPTDVRFDQTGVAGVPLMADDVDRIRAAPAPEREMLTDRAVLVANEALSRTYRHKLIGRDAGEDESLTTHGWVININADHLVHKIAAELTDMGVQYRLRKDIDAHGEPAMIITAYPGSMDDAEYVSDHLSARFGGKLRSLDRTDADSRYQFAEGIDGRFIPHEQDRAMLGIKDSARYFNGLPETHFSHPGMTPEQKVAVAEDYLSGQYGAYLVGSRETASDTGSSAALSTAAEKQKTTQVERKPDGLEL